MAKLEIPYTVMGGNHDNNETRHKYSLDAKHMGMISTYSTPHWALYHLDTVVAGEDYGRMIGSILRRTLCHHRRNMKEHFPPRKLSFKREIGQQHQVCYIASNQVTFSFGSTSIRSPRR